ncbi:hypothetical protein [Pseudomonas fluorescens]|uniref:Lipoprotein n=1 Tax=Pseudomonas fluorescens TaxID=294 RepID=A0A5E7V696_PSEFL|nr:hypothetical protein [Pseudomonas fluorescens]VVO43391.1 hypothetical protein PS833_06173 [Pseudomonas fluorescens]VVQ19221.1 hypothetical protein PS914_06273 [Pseudomonas fluorescens]
MHGAIRAAGFSLMTLFVSCGVGARDLDTRIGTIAMEGELPAHESIGKLYAELDFQQATHSFALVPAKPELASGQWKMPLLTPVNPQPQ